MEDRQAVLEVRTQELFIKRKGGVKTHQLPQYVKEYQWRRNLQRGDAFQAFLHLMHRGLLE